MTTKNPIAALIRDMNESYQTAARLLSRKMGASVEELSKEMDLPQDSARALVSRLRAKGLDIVNTEQRRWRVTGVKQG